MSGRARPAGTAPTYPGGAIVQAAREAAGVSRAQLGARMVPPVSRERVGMIESGRSPLTEDTLARIAAALGCELRILLEPQ